MSDDDERTGSQTLEELEKTEKKTRTKSLSKVVGDGFYTSTAKTKTRTKHVVCESPHRISLSSKCFSFSCKLSTTTSRTDYQIHDFIEGCRELYLSDKIRSFAPQFIL